MLHIRNLTVRTCGWLRYRSSSAAPFVVRASLEKVENTEGATTSVDASSNLSAVGKDRRLNTGMVAAAFASLHTADEIHNQSKTALQNKNLHTNTNSRTNNTADAKRSIDEKVVAADTVNALLATTENVTISRRHALRVVSILAEWTTNSKAKLSDFESDPRFNKICRVLGKSVKSSDKKNIHNYRTEDLNTVLGVTGDDEAAKLIASISLPQMVKVMSTLAQQKRRSTPLLRSLAFNITRCSEPLDLKQCADLLYAMSILNFPDNVLVERVCADVQSGLNENANKPAVVGSLLTSLGLLKYKEIDVLEGLSEWVLKHCDVCRPQDIAALLLTLATLNYAPTNSEKLYEVLPSQLSSADFSKSTDCLDVVWALVCLRSASEEQISSVLSEFFIDSLLEKEGLSFTVKMKLLNINAAAKLLFKDYKGPLISDVSEIHNVHINYSKQKQIMVSAIFDTLKSLLPSEIYLTTSKNTKMGFLIDAECYLDSKCNPLPVSSKSENSAGSRVAILALDYHDMCHNTAEPHGVTNLFITLLRAQGYEVLLVPHSEFQPRDKVIKRVQYLEAKLKEIACSRK